MTDGTHCAYGLTWVFARLVRLSPYPRALGRDGERRTGSAVGDTAGGPPVGDARAPSSCSSQILKSAQSGFESQWVHGVNDHVRGNFDGGKSYPSWCRRLSCLLRCVSRPCWPPNCQAADVSPPRARQRPRSDPAGPEPVCPQQRRWVCRRCRARAHAQSRSWAREGICPPGSHWRTRDR
jgi:hypothetical protein